MMITAPAATSERRAIKLRSTVVACVYFTGAVSLVMNSRIEPGVKQVDQQVHEYECEGYQEHQGLSHGVVTVRDRVDEQHADTVQVKDLLGDHQTADQKRELKTDHRDDW